MNKMEIKHQQQQQQQQQMETNIQNFYKNKVVFLTGGTGFLGKGVF